MGRDGFEKVETDARPNGRLNQSDRDRALPPQIRSSSTKINAENSNEVSGHSALHSTSKKRTIIHRKKSARAWPGIEPGTSSISNFLAQIPGNPKKESYY